jgi:vitamin B12 transporter
VVIRAAGRRQNGHRQRGGATCVAPRLKTASLPAIDRGSLPAAGRRIVGERVKRFRRLTGRWRAGAWALAGALAAHPAAAQPGAVALDEVLVTATRTEQRLADSLPSATVITRRQIESSQTPGLVELLGRQAGVEFARTGGPGSQASVFMRGTNSSQTLVLIDGVRMNTALTGAAALGGVSLDTVERIEIVRGNLSSLYGSEAIGGVIQIFTRGAEASGVEFGGEAGSGDLRAASAYAARRFDGGSVALSAAGRRSAPFSAIDASQVIPGPFAPGANPEVDGNRNGSASLRAQGRAGPLDLAASLWGNRNDTDFDSTADGPTATHEERSRQYAMQASAAGRLTERWRAQLTVARADDDTTNRSSQPWSFSNGEFESSNRSVTLANEVRLGERATASLAYEYLQQHGGATAYDPDLGGVLTRFERRVSSLRAGIDGRQGPHRLQASVRWDGYSDVGGATTGLVAYGYDIDRRWRVSAQLANAFRAPSFNDLYFPFFGNPALAPERARSGELALRYGDDHASVRVAAFRNQTTDLIVYDAAAQQARNVARADIDGIELTAAGRLHGWQLQADASVTRAEERSTGERLLRRAPYRLHLAASRSVGRVDGLLEVSYNAARDDTDINTFARTELAAYTLARLALAWRLTDALRLTLRVENLFDADYELVDGYATPGLAVFGGVALRIQ